MHHQPTVPMPPPQGQPQKRTGLLVAALIAVLLLGGGIGLLLSMSESREPTEPSAAPAPAGGVPAKLGTLEVVSVPADGTVTVDARLVGLTPIDRLDLDPGRHAVVIEVHGYQPYIGTITVEAGGASALEAHLAELGKSGRSTGTLTGPGKAVDRVPTTTAAAAPPDPEAEAAPDSKKSRRRARRGRDDDYYDPPPRAAPAYQPPRRDCSAEESACSSKCDDAHFSCWSSCKYCGSCVSSMTWDECNRICDTCKQGCEQNKDFCEASCEGVGDACRTSQQ